MLNKLITTVALVLVMISGTVAANEKLYSSSGVWKLDISYIVRHTCPGARGKYKPNKVKYAVGDKVRVRFICFGMRKDRNFEIVADEDRTHHNE